jgi:hypothetical protein
MMTRRSGFYNCNKLGIYDTIQLLHSYRLSQKK